MNPNLKIGVALLDKPDIPVAGGFYAIGREIGAFRTLSELEKSGDVIWMTNIGYKPYQDHKIFREGNVMQDQLLRSRTENLIKEFGLGDLSKQEIASVLARVGQSTFDYAAMMTGKPIKELSNSNQRLDWVLRERVKPQARYPGAADAPWISVALQAHLFNYATNPKKGDLVKRFYTVPRTEMARMLLARPYPSLMKHWQQIEFPKPITLTPGGKLPAELEGRASFVKASIRGLNPDRAEWSPFSMRNDRGAVVARNWIALPEALSYAQDAVVEVSAAFVNDYESLKLPHPLPPPSDDDLVSAQLYAESYIYALGGKTKIDAQSRKGSTGHCALAAYMWAWEKTYMAKLAKIFQSRGIGQVTTVGSLQIQIQLIADNIEMADTLAIALGLEPPMQPFHMSATSVAPYAESTHAEKPVGSRYTIPTFTDDQWVHDPNARIRLSTFSGLKAGGTLNDILTLDALASQKDKRELALRTIGPQADQSMRSRFPRLATAIQEKF